MLLAAYPMRGFPSFVKKRRAKTVQTKQIFKISKISPHLDLKNRPEVRKQVRGKNVALAVYLVGEKFFAEGLIFSIFFNIPNRRKIFLQRGVNFRKIFHQYIMERLFAGRTFLHSTGAMKLCSSDKNLRIKKFLQKYV